MSLELVKKPTLTDVAPRFMDLRRAVREQANDLMIGAIVTRFSNDEIRLLADNYLNIGEVATLRRLGVLDTNEGFDRSADPPPREWNAREWNAMTEQLQSLTARLRAVSLPVEEQQ